eukprot:m.110713 g.110713  ORF g.110713 m.110713 type:complete len:848 (-) comp9070_c1_seq2:149-2692(-)
MPLKQKKSKGASQPPPIMAPKEVFLTAEDFKGSDRGLVQKLKDNDRSKQMVDLLASFPWTERQRRINQWKLDYQLNDDQTYILEAYVSRIALAAAAPGESLPAAAAPVTSRAETEAAGQRAFENGVANYVSSGSLGAFEEYIKQIHYDESLIAPYGVLLQASGMGKSLLCFKYLEKNYGIYSCLRDPAHQGFPMASKWCDLLLPKAEAGSAQGSVEKSQHLLELRFKHFQSAVLEIFYQWYATQGLPAGPCGSPSDWFSYTNSLEFIQRLQSTFQSMFDGKQSITFTKSEPLPDVRFVFVFDEARRVAEHVHEGFRFARRAWKELRPLPIRVAVVATDTLSRLSNFTPIAHLDYSYRGMGVTQYRLPDVFFRLTTMDIFPPELFKEVKDPEQRRLKHLFSLGRPLWGQTLLADHSLQQQPFKNLIGLAQAKLLGGPLQVTWFVDDQAQRDGALALASLAICACRYGINVNPTSLTAASLVAGNCAACIDVSDDRSAVMIVYPSEPILAEAAAQLLYNENSARLAFVFQRLSSFVKNSVINVGEIGELVARVILCTAADDAVRARQNPYPKGAAVAPMFSSPVSLTSFLENLSRPSWSIIDKALEDRLGSTWKDSTEIEIHLSHFYAVADGLERMTAADLKRAFKRGAGLICEPGEEKYDAIIPMRVRVKTSDPEAVGDTVFGAIFIQIKNLALSGLAMGPAAYLHDPRTVLGKSHTMCKAPFLVLIINVGMAEGKVRADRLQSVDYVGCLLEGLQHDDFSNVFSSPSLRVIQPALKLLLRNERFGSYSTQQYPVDMLPYVMCPASDDPTHITNELGDLSLSDPILSLPELCKRWCANEPRRTSPRLT